MPGSRRQGKPSFKEKSDFLNEWFNDPQTYPDEFKSWLRQTMVSDPNIVWELSQIPVLPGYKLADGAIDSSKIADGSITDIDLAKTALKGTIAASTSSFFADGLFRYWSAWGSSFVFDNLQTTIQPNYITIPKAGWYFVHATIAGSAAGTVRVAVLLNDATVFVQNATSLAGTDNPVWQPHAVWVGPLAANDRLTLGGSSTGGGANPVRLTVIKLPW